MFCVALLLLFLASANSSPLPLNLGNYSFPISTSAPTAVHYFNLGIFHEFGFNQHESRLAMAKATEADPGCAMCWWGLAYAWGPFLNHPIMSLEQQNQTYNAIHHAQSIVAASPSAVTLVEQQLIAAAAFRFSTKANPTINQTIGFVSYATALGRMGKADPNVCVLYAQALMNLESNNYFKHETMGSDTQATVPQDLRPYSIVAYNVLRDMIYSPNTTFAYHPLALHLFIHLTEGGQPGHASKGAGLGEVAADRLLALNYTGSGHLEHMPGHLYLRVGRYYDAAMANVRARAADVYYTNDHMQPYGPCHNQYFGVCKLKSFVNQYNHRPTRRLYSFYYTPKLSIALCLLLLVFFSFSFAVVLVVVLFSDAANVAGMSRVAINGSQYMRDVYSKNVTRPDGPGLEQGWNAKLTTFVRFGLWTEILHDTEFVPSQAPGTLYASVLRHYARGLAFVHSSDASAMQAATHEWQQLQVMQEQIIARAALDPAGFNGMAVQLAVVANATLSAGILLAKGGSGDVEAAVTLLAMAAQNQDDYHYDEPPDWHISMHECLGQVLLDNERASQAELSFQKDLQAYPENGWGLTGLVQSLVKQNKSKSDIDPVRLRLIESWKHADVPMPLSACLAFDFSK